jgi:hypothetical protein
LVPSSASYQAAVQHASAALAAQGVPPQDVASRAIGLIGRIVMQQATLLAYIDVFYGYVVVAAALVPVAFILLRPGEGRAPAAAH